MRVAVGVIRDAQGRVLIARRPAHVHQGGLWEFPGGKLEPGETVEAALTRELEEELHLRLLRSSPLLVVRHVYPERSVVLEVREVTDWQGKPHGRDKSAWSGLIRPIPGTHPSGRADHVQICSGQICARTAPDKTAGLPFCTAEPPEGERTGVRSERCRAGIARHENQPILWVAPERLPEYAFPAANAPIVTAARLPETYAILDIAAFDADDLAGRFNHLAGRGITLLQLRAKTLAESDYRRAAAFLLALARGTFVRVLLNAAPELAEELDAHGVHLTSRRLMALRERPLNASRWVAASCHDEEELLHAQRLGLDFAVLAPVRATATHPGATPLGWQRFAELCRSVSLPVYAMGGLSLPDVDFAREMGGRGIAAIRAFLEKER